MFHSESGPDRSKLGFKEVVLASFKFLDKYGFRCVRAEPTLVQYKTRWPFSRKELFVNVYHGRGSYELGVELGRRGGDQTIFTLPLIVEWVGHRNRESFDQEGVFQASTREGVQKFVPKLAELVQEYAKPFLQGDPEAYKSAAELVRRESVLYEKEMLLRRMREKGERAWHAKDYAQVVSLYEPFQEDLSRSEAMRLDYAKKQVARPAEARSER